MVEVLGENNKSLYIEQKNGMFSQNPEGGRSGFHRDEWSNFEIKYEYFHAEKNPDGSGVNYYIEPGREVTEEYHPSGTSTFTMADGSVDVRIQNSKREYIKGGSTLTVHDNSDLKYNGHVRTTITGGNHTETKGNISNFAMGTSTTYVAQQTSMFLGSNYSLAADGSVGLSSGANRNATATLDADGTITIRNGGSTITMTPGGDITITGASITLEGPMTFKGNIDHQGSMSTSGTHTDSIGPHDAPGITP